MVLQIMCMIAPMAATFFAGTFADVIIVSDWVHGRICGFGHFQGVDGGQM